MAVKYSYEAVKFFRLDGNQKKEEPLYVRMSSPSVLSI